MNILTEQAFKGINFDYSYVFEGKEYRKEQVNDNNELKKVFLSSTDNAKFSQFRNKVIEIVGEKGYASIKIFPENYFKGYDQENNLIAPMTAR
jgi:hypothetical protein